MTILQTKLRDDIGYAKYLLTTHAVKTHCKAGMAHSSLPMCHVVSLASARIDVWYIEMICNVCPDSHICAG